MSLMNTKPRWAQNAIATASGWSDPVTGEVYIAIGNLAARLAAEHAKTVDVPVIVVQEPVNPDYVAPVEVVAQDAIEDVKIEEVKEIVMQEEIKEEIVKPQAKRGRPAKVKIDEIVENPLQGKQIIGEVVEYPDVQIIGE